MYQEFFKFSSLPFTLTPNPKFFCQLKGHEEALNTLLFCIQSGEGFIKIVGEVGAGKTLLCRKLLEKLPDPYVTAYIPNPDLNPVELRKAFARELGLDPVKSCDQHELLNSIYQHLIQLYQANKKVILIIDEAQALSDESLETVRLLTNLETENDKLLQVVLFGQSELDDRLNQPHLRQLKQRISFSCMLPTMNRQELDVYLHHRLAVAGYTQHMLFTKKARQILYKASRGIPRIVNIITHKALLIAYGRGDREINHHTMKLAANDTEAAQITFHKSPMLVLIGIIFATLFAAIIGYLTGSVML